METIVYQIELNDGRIFRIFCANSTQKKKVIDSYYRIKDKVKGNYNNNNRNTYGTTI